MAATNDVVNCSKCEKEIDIDEDRFLFCTNKKCKKCFHKKCSNVSDLNYKKYLKDKHKIWFCDSCLNTETEKLQIRHATRSTTKEPETTVAEVHMQPSNQESTPIQGTQNNDSIQLKDMNVFMKEIHVIVKEIRVEQANICKNKQNA